MIVLENNLKVSYTLPLYEIFFGDGCCDMEYFYCKDLESVVKFLKENVIASYDIQETLDNLYDIDETTHFNNIKQFLKDLNMKEAGADFIDIRKKDLEVY